MDWDEPREPTPAPTDPGVHYWERHYTNASTIVLIFLGMYVVFAASSILIEGFLYGNNPFRNWERGLTAASAFGVFVSGYIWIINYRRIIAITDTTLHLGSAHIPFTMISSAELLSKDEARAIHRGIFREQGFLPPLWMAIAIRNSNITLMAPRYMPHKFLIKANSQYLVGIQDPERFLAAFEHVKSVHDAERERRRLANLDPRYSLLDQVLEERQREQETGRYPLD